MKEEVDALLDSLANNHTSRVHTPPLSVLRPSVTIGIPDIDVDLMEDGSSVKLILNKLDENISVHSSMAEAYKDRKLTPEDLRKLKHDLVFHSWGDTDMSLHTLFPDASNQILGMNLTPDYIRITGDAASILEFGTTMNTRPLAPAKRKISKYQEGILSILNNAPADVSIVNRFMIHTIMVGPNSVSTTLNLPQDLVNDLIFLHRVGTNLLSKVEDATGINYADITQENITLSKIKTNAVLNQFSFACGPAPNASSSSYELNRESLMFAQSRDTEQEVPRHKSLFREYAQMLGDEMMETRQYLENKVQLDSEYNKDAEAKIKQYWASLDSRDCKLSTKSIHPIPLMRPEVSTKDGSHNDIEVPFLKSDDTPDYVFSLWSQLSSKKDSNYTYDEWKPKETLEEALKRSTTNDADLKNEKRGTVFLVHTTFTHEEKSQMALRGVDGKQYAKTHPNEYKHHKFETQKPIHKNSKTEDIDKWLHEQAPSWLKEDASCVPESISNPVELIDLSLQMYKSADDVEADRDDIAPWATGLLGTQGCIYYDMVSEIGQELAFSIQSKTRGSSWALKKLPNYDIWLAIKPVAMKNRVLFSIFMPKRGNSDYYATGVHRSMYDLGSGWATEIISVNDDKLLNWTRAGPLYIALFAQFYRFYGCSITESAPCDEVYKDLALGMLIAMEDKARTEEIMTTVRFVLMDKFTAPMCKVDFTKMLPKMPTHFRSRLELWATKKVTGCMLSGPYTRVLEDYGDDVGAGPSQQVRWVGLKHPYLGHDLDSAPQLIELFYLGYAKNKNESSSTNVDLDLIKKVVDEEVKYRDTNKKSLQQLSGRPAIVTGHECALEVVKHASERTRQYLKTMHGSNWEDTYMANLSRKWHSTTWEDLATLKASSLYDGMQPSVPGKDGRHKIARQRAAEAALKMTSESKKVIPLDHLMACFIELRTQGYISIDLFRKNQHGGLREIYVLGFRERLIQKFVEDISKTLCDMLPMETLTSPENKSQIPIDHVVEAHRVAGSSRDMINLNMSADAKTWSQATDAPKLAFFLCGVLPLATHDAIRGILSLWSHKRIRLPDGVLDLVEKYKDRRDEIHLTDPTHMKVLNAAWGVTREDWFDTTNRCLVIASGFMQGILHYTSSAFHAGCLIARDDLFKQFCKNADYTVVTNDMVSSDDSARLVTICPIKGCDKLEKVVQVLTVVADQRISKAWYSKSGIQMSPKTTYCTPALMEFNSVFHIGPTTTKPILKWVYASHVVLEIESLYERQESLYASLTQLLEAGAPFSQCFVTQISQALLHYRLIGMCISPIREDAKEMMKTLPSPMLGFFMMDNPISPGLMGLQYAHWVHSSHQLVSQFYSLMLEKNDTTTTSRGTIIKPILLRYSDHTKWEDKVRAAEEYLPEWRDLIQESPEPLFRAAESNKEALIKILVKLANPTLGQALGRGHSLVRLMASAVYILTSCCISTKASWWTTVRSTDRKKRVPLASVIHESSAAAETHESTLTPEQSEFLFCHNEEYEMIHSRLVELLPSYDRCYVQVNKGRMMKVRVPVVGETSALPISLETLVKHKWFGSPVQSARSVIEITWTKYLSAIDWLRDTAHETLEASPFDDFIQLRNYIAREEGKSRSVVLSGVPFKKASNEDPVLSVVRRNQWPGVEIPLVDPSTDATNYSAKSQLVQRLQTASLGPFSLDHKRETMIEVLCNSDAKLADPGTGRLVAKRRFQYLRIIQKVCLHKDGRIKYSNEDFIHDISVARAGVIGGFIQVKPSDFTPAMRDLIRKEPSTSKWQGLTIWIGNIGKFSVRVSMVNNKLWKFETNDWKGLLTEEEGMLMMLLRDLKMVGCIESKTFSMPRAIHVSSEGTVKITSGDMGVYIETDSNLSSIDKTSYVDINKMNVSLDNANRLQLTTSARLYTQGLTIASRLISILKFPTLPMDYKGPIRDPTIHPHGDHDALTSSWINSNPAKPDHLASLIDWLIRGARSEHKDIFDQYWDKPHCLSLMQNAVRSYLKPHMPQSANMMVARAMDVLPEVPTGIFERQYSRIESNFASNIVTEVEECLQEALAESPEDLGDYVDGLMKAIMDAELGECEQTSNPYINTSFSDEYLRDMGTKLGQVELEKLAAKIKTKANKNYAEIIGPLMGWEYTEESESLEAPAPSGSSLQVRRPRRSWFNEE